MKINAKIHYGLKTMIELGLNFGSKGLLQKEIAEKQCMPNRFMESVIHDLKVAGLITSGTGKKSGYSLLKDPKEIMLYDIYKAFNPDIKIHFCLAANYVCERSANCACHCFFFDLNRHIETYLKSLSLKDLLEKQKSLDLDLKVD